MEMTIAGPGNSARIQLLQMHVLILCKLSPASADTTTVGSTSVGANANATISINISGTHPTAAEIEATVVDIVETINHLKSVLRSAGILT